MHIAIIGNGKMGTAVAALAQERGHIIQTVIRHAENADGQALTGERLRGVDVAVEFTRPDCVVRNLERLGELGIPTVTGTTGWADELPRVSHWFRQRRGALLHAANFAVGVHLFLRAAREMARAFRGRSEFSVSIEEEHHRSKLDSPSGTALLLQGQLRTEDHDRDFPISSTRLGDAVGTHTLRYDGPYETVTLRHATQNRKTFAAGALSAAEWLPGHEGVFTFEQMLFGPS
ncbi:MAG: 4-hydroxy-tetrahydrodipicolinate reductase [Gemmatimonadales bacterium]